MNKFKLFNDKGGRTLKTKTKSLHAKLAFEEGDARGFGWASATVRIPPSHAVAYVGAKRARGAVKRARGLVEGVRRSAKLVKFAGHRGGDPSFARVPSMTHIRRRQRPFIALTPAPPPQVRVELPQALQREAR